VLNARVSVGFCALSYVGQRQRRH